MRAMQIASRLVTLGHRGRLVVLAIAGVTLGGCGVVDAIVPPTSGPCEIVALDPSDENAGFGSGAACVILTWDSSTFPSTVEGREPDGLRQVSVSRGYLEPCSTTFTPLDPTSPDAQRFAGRYGPFTPGSRTWAVGLFLLDHGDGATKGYCRDWLDIR
jgi:hypothetical protein